MDVDYYAEIKKKKTKLNSLSMSLMVKNLDSHPPNVIYSELVKNLVSGLMQSFPLQIMSVIFVRLVSYTCMSS